jgi:preprotein translocase subunit SecY|tara:strand:- start:7272 stop:8549 length:1278 start_codon:yes stop_codon:yes gene_type:complete
MEVSETINLLQKKILKIFGFLILIRLGLYIPVPNVDLDIFSQNQVANPLFGLAKSLTGSSFLGVGALGILPYINSSIIIQLLTPIVPALERLQKEEGELGRQQITKYTRYLTLGWAIVLSTAVAFILVKPVVFNWNLILALKIIFSLTTGSMLSMWFAELITNENLGNGSSMVIFINIIGGLPASMSEFTASLENSSSANNFGTLFLDYGIYLLIVGVIILVQESYKRVNIVSARQLNFNYLEQASPNSKLKSSYIPIKLNQGGIMPLVFSTTIATFLLYPLQLFLSKFLTSLDGGTLTSVITFVSLGLNLVLIVFFSTFYALLVLKPKDLSDNLTKMAYNVPGIKQGKETTQHLEQIISRLAFMGGLFLAFLAFFPILIGNLLKFNVFKNLTSLIILVGVITDVTSQIKGFLVSQNYENFNKKV